MKLQIKAVYDRGVLSKERIHLVANADIDLKFYLMLDTTYTAANSISNLERHAFWFSPRVIKAGENVVLYTKKGTESVETKENLGKFHFLYRGLDQTVWNKDADCAVLFEINTWATTPLPRPIFD